MLEDLLEGRPVVDHDLPKKRDLVDLGDSDDEEVAVTDTSSGEKDTICLVGTMRLGKPVVLLFTLYM